MPKKKVLTMLAIVAQIFVCAQLLTGCGFSKDQAVDLAIKLNSGALPVPVEIIEMQTILPEQK